MRSVVCITLPQRFGTDGKSLKAAVWLHPSLQSVFALYLQERSALIKHHWIQQILKDMLVFCALVCIVVMKSTLLAWWKKMGPVSQPQTKPQCVCPRGEKMSSRGTENQNFAQCPCSMPGMRVPAFPVGCDSLLLTNITPKKKKIASEIGLRDRNTYTAVAATSQMCCCVWTTRIIWQNVPTFAVFPSFVETNESRLE